MQHDWKTQAYDLQIAEEIIDKHLQRNNGSPLGMLDVVVQDDQKISCEISDWVIELAEHYHDLYGLDQGMFVTKKIITRCMVGHHTIH